MKYLVWLNEVMGAGNPRSVRALEHFGSAQKIYNATKTQRETSGIFSKKEITKINKTPLSIATDIISDCINSGIDYRDW